MDKKRTKINYIEAVEKANRDVEKSNASTNFQAKMSFLWSAITRYRQASESVPSDSEREKILVKIGNCFELLAIIYVSCNRDPRERILESYAEYSKAKDFDDITTRLTALKTIIECIEENYSGNAQETLQFFFAAYELGYILEIRSLLFQFIMRVISAASLNNAVSLSAMLHGRGTLDDTDAKEALLLMRQFQFLKEYSDALILLKPDVDEKSPAVKLEMAVEILCDLRTKWRHDCPSNNTMAEICYSLLECYSELKNPAKVKFFGSEIRELLPPKHPILLKLELIAMEEENQNEDKEDYKSRAENIEGAFKVSIENGIRLVLEDFIVSMSSEYEVDLRTIKTTSDRQLRSTTAAKVLKKIVCRHTHPDLLKNNQKSKSRREYCTEVTQILNSVRQNL